MQKEFYWDDKQECDTWGTMWTRRTIEEELAACDIETPPRELFLKCIPMGDRIVDAGCGFGKWVIYLHRRGYDILGVDNNELAVSTLKEFDRSLQVEAGDILHIPYPDNHFGAYISMGVVEHFEEGPQAALNEAYRLIRPGGLIFVSVPTINMVRRVYRRPLRFFVQSMMGSLLILYRGWGRSRPRAVLDAMKNLLPERVKKMLAGSKGRFYHFTEYRYSRAELEGFLQQAGFEVLETMPHDFYGSGDHAIGVSLDFPFLRSFGGEPMFKLNLAGRLVSRTFDRISPWIACSSVICVARSTKAVS